VIPALGFGRLLTKKLPPALTLFAPESAARRPRRQPLRRYASVILRLCEMVNRKVIPHHPSFSEVQEWLGRKSSRP